jgi:hypothetical protein
MRKQILILTIISGLFILSCNTISIENETYENRPHFKIETRTATYCFDKAGGGLSRIIDSDGIDWIYYNGDPRAVSSSGASGDFRGIPNVVYRMEDGGAVHPGFDQCISEKSGKNVIRTRNRIRFLRRILTVKIYGGKV